jgi:beta-mannosidase
MTKYYSFLLLLIACILTSSCKRKAIPKNIEIRITDNWTFRKADNNAWLPATVPGDVMINLAENHKIADPYDDTSEPSLQWIGLSDWEYRTTFDTPLDVLKNDVVNLHFAGLDTYCDVYLNGALVLKADNMFRSWDIPCKRLLKERGNSLRIYFHSSVNMGLEKLKQAHYPLTVTKENADENERTSVVTRKAPYQYGGEFSPRLVSCGIWRPVSLRAWSNAHIADIYLHQNNISAEIADYTAHVDIQVSKPGDYELSFYVNDDAIGTPFMVQLNSGNNLEKFSFQITKPNLWWCNGMGSHYMYNLRVDLAQKDRILSSKVQPFGVRKLELVQDSDAYGRSFYLKLNNVPVFAKGASYIPMDMFPSRVTGARYEQLVNDAVDANMNMLRIWGGGIYENDSLYEQCDRKGIMVWHDFIFPCGTVPDDSSFVRNLRADAAEQVKRLRNHPCMALWCGNNEIKLFWEKEGWKKQYPQKVASQIWDNYLRIFNGTLPRIVNALSPHIPYWPSSPSSFDNVAAGKVSGDEHQWSVWFDAAPFSAWEETPGRFVSEYGMQSYPCMQTIRSFAGADTTRERSPMMEYRQRCTMPWITQGMNGNQMISDYVQMYYNKATDFGSFVYLSQVMQARALKTAIESHRINRPRCMGSIFWHLNDCWPGITWSTIDYYGRRKAAHYAVRKAFANILVVPVLTDNKVKIYAVSDTLVPLDAVLNMQVIDFKGNKQREINIPINIKPNTSQLIQEYGKQYLCSETQTFKTCMVARLLVDNKILSENIVYFTDPQYLDLPIPDITTTMKRKQWFV